MLLLLSGLCLFASSFASRAGVVTNLTQTNLTIALTNGGPVTFAASGTLILSKTIVITNDTTIDGAGFTVTLSGTNAVRVFLVTNNATLTLRNLVIANGRSTNGAGIFNASGTVNISFCNLVLNNAFGVPANDGRNGTGPNNGGNGGNGTPALGGGIYNRGTVTLSRVTLFGNIAAGSNGGQGGDGGDDSAFGGNGGDGGNGSSGSGGAIYNEATGIVFATNCTFQFNAAGGGDGGLGGLGGTGPFPGLPGDGGVGGAGAGGGIYNLGQVIINNSTFITNLANGGNSSHAGADKNGANGGVANGGAIFNRGTVTMTNSTLTQNFTSGGNGGDVFTGNFIDGGNGGSAIGGAIHNDSNSVFIVNCTLATNSAAGGSGGISGFTDNNGSTGASLGGNIYRKTGTVFVRNSILAKGTGPNSTGVITDGGYNLSSDSTPAFLGSSTSRNNQNPKLASLAQNGGISPTLALLPGSPAIDKADPNLCFGTDQRGVARPQGNACDIGAFEWVPTFSISGKITDGTNGVAGVVVMAFNTTSTNGVLSITNGTYSISNLVEGTYTATAGASYTPSNYVVTLSTNFSATNLNFRYVGMLLSSVSFSTNSNGRIQFLLTTKPSVTSNQTYFVQRSSNLVSWTDFGSLTNITNGILQVGVTNAALAPLQFFRVISR